MTTKPSWPIVHLATTIAAVVVVVAEVKYLIVVVVVAAAAAGGGGAVVVVVVVGLICPANLIQDGRQLLHWVTVRLKVSREALW